MSETVIEGHSCIPNKPVVMLPNRIDREVVEVLEKTLGLDHISWILEPGLLPDAGILDYLRPREGHRTDGLQVSLAPDRREQSLADIRRKLESGRHVVMLLGRPAQNGGMLTDMPAGMLAFWEDCHLPVQPVFVGMYNPDTARGIVTEAPYRHLRIQFTPVFKASSQLPQRVRSIWMECSAAFVHQHPLLQKASLPRLFLESLNRHPHACLIDGVNDTRLSYREALVHALLLARYFKKHHTARRLGIILPPGKLAVIAHLACLFAGISAVPINYTVQAAVFQEMAKKAGVTRFITEARFVNKQQGFAWPRPRDLILIEQVLMELRSSFPAFLLRLPVFRSVERLISQLDLDSIHPDDEAALLFTNGATGSCRGVPMTHRMLTAGIIQAQSRLELHPGERVLSCMPFFQSSSYTLGLLLPLALGCDLVTYPSPRTPRRLCELIAQNQVRLMLYTPSLLPDLLEKAEKETFRSMDYLLTSGEPLSQGLLAEAYRRFHLVLLNAYGLKETGMPVSFNVPRPTPAPHTRYTIPGAAPEAAGAPLPGIAVRIAAPGHAGESLPAGVRGIIWLKGSQVIQGYLDDPQATATYMRGSWFDTGDVGLLDEQGLLTICGRKSRFSRIGGELVAHELVEEVLYRVLKADPRQGGRKLAIVGQECPMKDDALILLSTLHRNVFANDLITMRYGIMNEGYPALWCPARILPVPSIPQLPDGKLDYPACLRLVAKALTP